MVRERDLYRALRSKVKNTTSARQMMERLRKVADLYAALTNPEHQYWTDFPADIRSYLEALLLFKVTQYRPVALAAMELSTPDNIVKLFRLLTVISFRYTVISALGTGNLEKTYTNTALAIRKGDAKGLKDIFSYLKSIYVDDEQMVNDFSRKHFSKSDVTRYILSEINDHLEREPERRVADREGRVTLEHIMPKNLSESWKTFIPNTETHSNFVELIGNLTLLEKGLNRSVANLSFEQKKTKAFSQSSLEINKFINKSENWTIEDIQERTDFLAKVSSQTWRVDY